MADELAMKFVQKLTGKSEPQRAMLSQNEAVMQFRSLNRDGWRKLIQKYGVDEVRNYHDHMTNLSTTLGV